MNSDRINRWLTLGANFGVLIGLIILIFELNQNERLMESQVRNQLSSEIVKMFSLIASDEDLANIRRRADEGDSLNADERYRYESMSRAIFRYWENVHFQYRKGLYDDEEFDYQMGSIERYFKYSKTLSDYWCDTRTEYSIQFRQELDKRINKLGIMCE